MPGMLRARMTRDAAFGTLLFGFLVVLVAARPAEAATLPSGAAVQVVDLDQNGALVRDIAIFRAMNANGSKVLFTVREPFTNTTRLYLRDISASTTVQIAASDISNPISSTEALSDDGNVIAYQTGYTVAPGLNHLYLHDRRTNAATHIAADAADMSVALSADGRYLAYRSVSDGSDAVFLYDAKTGVTEPIADGASSYTDVTMTPDASFVAFNAYEAGMARHNILVYDRALATTTTAVAGSGAYIPLQLALSDDGRYFAYHVRDSRGKWWYEAESKIEILDRQREETTPVHDGQNISVPTRNFLSGDGRFVIDSINVSPNAFLMAYDRDQASSTSVFSSPAGFNAREISSNGAWIALSTCDPALFNTTSCQQRHLILVSNPFLPPPEPPAPPPPTGGGGGAGCLENCFSNVMFLPGIEGSRLYRPDVEDGTEKLWEPFGDQDVRDLYLDDDGEGLRDDVYAKEGDIIDELPNLQNIYKSFIERMNSLKNEGKISDWKPIAYDWRLSLNDLLVNGRQIDDRLYYTGPLGATSSPYIIQELRRLAASSKTKKVTIIAHSNGGLLAKQLTETLGSEAANLIDKMIFIAVPQVGTPEAVYEGMRGQPLGYGWAATANVTRAFASTSPMFYHLLPSSGYFTSVYDPVVSFDSSLPDWQVRYGNQIQSEASLRAFLTDSYGRVDAETGNLNQPVQLRSNLLSAAESLHVDLDSWTPPHDVELIQIAGWGVDRTVRGVAYTKSDAGVRPIASTTVDGDGTVVIPSALWTSTLVGATNFYVNLQKFNSALDRILNLHFSKADHGNILEIQELGQFIEDNLTDSVKTIDLYTYLRTDPPSSTEKRLNYRLHSPLNLHAFDNEGRHTGISTTTNQVEEQIPGSYYAEYGDVKYLFTEPDVPVHIVMEGYDTGSFTLEVEELLGDDVQSFTTWRDMPVTPDTEATIDQPGDFSSLSPLSIDKNGDGVMDYEIEPVPDQIIELPKVPLLIKPNDETVPLGYALPPFTYTLSGFIAGETATTSDITGSAQCGVEPIPVTGGTFTISCDQGTLASKTYEFETSPGTLKVVYRWDGFLQPINDTAHQVGLSASVFKAGSTVPVKLQLKKADGTPVQAALAQQWSEPERLGLMTASVDESLYSGTASTGGAYRWDAASQQYIYNWNTKGFAPGYWYRVFAKLDDGTINSVVIGLR